MPNGLIITLPSFVTGFCDNKETSLAHCLTHNAHPVNADSSLSFTRDCGHWSWRPWRSREGGGGGCWSLEGIPDTWVMLPPTPTPPDPSNNSSFEEMFLPPPPHDVIQELLTVLTVSGHLQMVSSSQALREFSRFPVRQMGVFTHLAFQLCILGPK